MDRELESLLDRIDKGGERALGFREIERLGALYRGAAAELAELRRRGHDKTRLRYVDSIVRRAHFAIYTPPRRGGRPLFGLLLGGFARVFRQTLRLQLLSAALFFLGSLAAYLAVRDHVEMAYPLLGIMLPVETVQGLISSADVRSAYLTVGQLANMGERSMFVAGLAANNMRAGMLAFSVGIAGGLPTCLLTLLNGGVLGAMAALYDRHGFDLDFWAWVLPHGVPEILALVISSAAGLGIGLALIDPGGRPRREALVAAGKKAAVLVGFALFLFAYAALIEGYFRQLSIGPWPRIALAAANLLLLGAYLWRAGTLSSTTPAP